MPIAQYDEQFDAKIEAGAKALIAHWGVTEATHEGREHERQNCEHIARTSARIVLLGARAVEVQHECKAREVRRKMRVNAIIACLPGIVGTLFATFGALSKGNIEAGLGWGSASLAFCATLAFIRMSKEGVNG